MENIKVNIKIGGKRLDRKHIVILCLVLIILLQFSIPIYSDGFLDIKAEAAVLMDYHTGKILYEQNPDKKLPPASISKIMTLLLGMEALENGIISLQDEVRISKHAAGMGGSQLWLEEGEVQTVEALFKAIVLRSANDASVALAEHISGSEEVFVNMMNEKAREIGMVNSNFTNASGLPDDSHYVSAKDVAIMSRELLRYDKIHDWLTIYMDEIPVGKKKDKIAGLVNTNRLVKEYEGTTGIKTGSTQEAGFCLSASAKKDNLHLIAVILKADTSRDRFDESIRLLDYGFATYESIPIGKKGDIIGKINTDKGNLDYIEAILERDAYILTEKGKQGDIQQEIILPEFVESPVDKGEKVGELIIKLANQEIDRINLVSRFQVEKANFYEIFKKMFKYLLTNG